MRQTQVLVVACLALLSGCAVGPDFKQPTAPDGAGYSRQPIVLNNAQQFVMGRDIAFAWWEQFNSPQLNALVERALKNNPTLAAAEAGLRSANEYVKAQQGYFYPTMSPNFSPTRNKIAGNQSGNAPGLQGNGSNITGTQNPTQPYNAPIYYNFYTAQLNLSYTPDVFGANRRQVEALQASANVSRYQMEATYITLATNVVAAAIQAGSLQAQIKATQAYIDANAKGVEILHKQQQAGYVMGIDVANQEAALAQAKQLLPPLMKQLAQTQDLIRALCGEMPNATLEDEIDFSALQLPQNLPLSLPSQLVAQRPDVKAAEEQFHAASAAVGVAMAARLPQFTISGVIGGGATVIPEIARTGGPFWSLVGGITAPIFDGGTLLHKQRAAEAELTQAQAQYRNTVMSAFQNVADTLHAIKSDADAQRACAEAEQAAKKVVEITSKQYQAGYVSFQTLLAAQQAYEQAKITLIQAKTNSYGDTAALFQALGGGWWHRDNAALN